MYINRLFLAPFLSSETSRNKLSAQTKVKHIPKYSDYIEMLTKNCSRSFGSKARILRADREKNELSSGGAMSSQPDVCRICWCEALPDDGYKLISPCECAGSMVGNLGFFVIGLLT